MIDGDIVRRMLAYRAKYNLSQEEFAERAQLSLMTVNAVENSRRTPTALTRAKIERVLEDKKEEIENEEVL